MSLQVVDGMMLEGAFCTRCKDNVLVDDSRACPDCGERVHPLSLSRPDKPATGQAVTISEVRRPEATTATAIATKTAQPPARPAQRHSVVPAVPSARAWENATDALIADLEQQVARAADLERHAEGRRAEAEEAAEMARRRHAAARKALADMRKVRGMVRVDGEAVAPSAANDDRPWSRNFAACRVCQTTERRHAARGLCSRCYDRWNAGAVEGDF